MYYVLSEGRPGICVAVSVLLTSGYVYDPDYVDTENNACEAPNQWRRINSDNYLVKVITNISEAYKVVVF